MFIAIISVILTVVSTFFLAKSYKINGLAIGRIIGFITQAVLLLIFIIFLNLKEKKIGKINPKPIFDSVKIIAANLFLFFLFFFFNIKLTFFEIDKLNVLFTLFINSVIFFFIYFIICYILRMDEITFFARKIINKLNFKKNKV